MANRHTKRAKKFSQIDKVVATSVEKYQARNIDTLIENKAVSLHAIERFCERVLDIPFAKRHIRPIEKILLSEVSKSLLELKLSSRVSYLDDYTIVVHRGVIVTVVKE